MPETDFSEGVYTIVSAYPLHPVIDQDNGKVVTNPFVGCESQQWDLKKVLGIAWSLQNVSTGRYLGLREEDTTGDSRELYEVEHPFPWHLRGGNPKSRITLGVPFTDHVAHLPSTAPGTVLVVRGRQGVNYQDWYLSDLHLGASKALLHGGLYCILNAQSNTAIEPVRGKAACFKPNTDNETQKFLAIETENGWAFRHLESQQYLGLPYSTTLFQAGTQLSLVKNQFTWIVLPHYEDTSKFTLWIPFTSMVMDLHDGGNKDDNPIHLHLAHEVECQLWRFQPSLAITNGNIDHSEPLPGPPRSWSEL